MADCQHRTSAILLTGARSPAAGNLDLDFECDSCGAEGVLSLGEAEIDQLLAELSHLVDWTEEQ